MQQEIHKILNLQENATHEEIESAYNNLRATLREDMFLEGHKGNEAAKNLTKLDTAYQDYIYYKSIHGEQNDEGKVFDIYADIEALVKAGKLNEAQTKLDDINVRGGNWQYYQALIYYKKDWFTDCKRHLEKAVELEPSNQKFKDTLDRLGQKMSGGEQKTTEQTQSTANNSQEWWKQPNQGNTSGTNGQSQPGQPNWEENNRQMGGCDQSMNCCLNMLCLNMMCNCCGGGC